MAGKSNIEWTEHTWNPIVGCSVLSPGCTNCYAMRMAARIIAMAGTRDVGVHYDRTIKDVKGKPVWTGHVAMAPERILLEPLRRKKPTTYFVNSMGDLFHENIPDEWIDRVFAVMALCPQHTFQVLTKRAERMRAWMTQERTRTPLVECIAELYVDNPEIAARWPFDQERAIGVGTRGWPLPNVWLGVSCERQQEADERIPLLLQTPAAVRFISAEPLIGPIDLTRVRHRLEGESFKMSSVLEGDDGFGLNAPRNRVDWVIVGGESGPGSRPMHPDWARKIRDDCAAAGVPFFFKQWGNWAPDTPDTGAGSNRDPIFEGKGPCAKFGDGKWEFSENGFTMPLGGDHEWMYRLGKKSAGRLLDGQAHDGMPGR